MGPSQLAVVLSLAMSSLGQSSEKSEFQLQNEIYRGRWGTDLVQKFDDLPTSGGVPEYRVPYSGYIYPDTAGGTIRALYKYDRAFNRGRGRAASHERWDTMSGQELTPRVVRYGLFGGRAQVVGVRQIPYWHGHCNGWTAAAIRHPEPEKSIRANGVVFTPADIKSLLAEVYIYSDIDYLAGEYGLVTPAMFHITIANWLGREQYPVAMEATPGKEKWNYPIFAFTTTSAKRGDRRVEVKMNLAYSNYSDQELHRSPRLKLVKYFHYMLDLDTDGKIVGGYYFRDSSQIDLLWAPLPPIPGGKPGNERGNPYIDVETVLAMCRQSAASDLLAKWFNDRQSFDAVSSEHEEPAPTNDPPENVSASSSAPPSGETLAAGGDR